MGYATAHHYQPPDRPPDDFSTGHGTHVEDRADARTSRNFANMGLPFNLLLSVYSLPQVLVAGQVLLLQILSVSLVHLIITKDAQFDSTMEGQCGGTDDYT